MTPLNWKGLPLSPDLLMSGKPVQTSHSTRMAYSDLSEPFPDSEGETKARVIPLHPGPVVETPSGLTLTAHCPDPVSKFTRAEEVLNVRKSMN